MGDRKIICLTNTWLKEIRQRGNGFSLKTNRRDNNKIILCNYLLYAIGREPALDFLSSSLKKKSRKAKNVFYIGDVKNGDRRQLAIAVGDGVRAAMDIVFECRGMGVTEHGGDKN